MPEFLINLWNQIVTLWDKFIALVPEPDASKIVPFVNELPVTVEAIIQLLRITAIAAAAMGLISLFSAIGLNNGLPIKKAKQFLAKRKQPVVIKAEPIVTILDLPNFDTIDPKKEKRPLVSFKLTEDAQKLLDKITVDVNTEDGWNVAPGKKSAA